MAHTVVLFQRDNSVECVPLSWIEKGTNGTVCYWPAGGRDQKKKIRRSEMPDKDSWTPYDVRILGKPEYPDYETAIKYAKKAEDTTNIESDDETQTGRQRKRPKRFDSPVLYSSSGEEAEVEGEQEHNRKHITTPPPPPFPGLDTNILQTTDGGSNMQHAGTSGGSGGGGTSMLRPDTPRGTSYGRSTSMHRPDTPRGASYGGGTSMHRPDTPRGAPYGGGTSMHRPDTPRGASYGGGTSMHRPDTPREASYGGSTSMHRSDITRGASYGGSTSMHTPDTPRRASYGGDRQGHGLLGEGDVPNTTTSLCIQVLEKLENLEIAVNEIKKMLKKKTDDDEEAMESIEVVLPEGRKLDSTDALQKFDEHLNVNTRKRMVRILQSIEGGSNLPKICREL